MLKNFLSKSLIHGFVLGLIFISPTWAMDRDERVAKTHISRSSTEEEGQNQEISFPLHKIQTTKGIFYLLGTTHDLSGSVIPQGVWSIINQCDYGIQEHFTDGLEVKLFQKQEDSLVREYIMGVLTNPNHGIFINEKVVKFFNKIKESLDSKRSYTNPNFTQRSHFKYSLDIISDIANGSKWSEKEWGEKFILGSYELNPLLFTPFCEFGALLADDYLHPIFTKNYDGGVDDVIERAFKKTNKPIYGLEGFMADFPKETFQESLQKLVNLAEATFQKDENSILRALSVMDTSSFAEGRKTASELSSDSEEEESFSVDYFDQDEYVVFRNNIWLPRLPVLVDLHPGKKPLIYVGRDHSMDLLKKIETQKILGDVVTIQRYCEREGENWEPFKWENVLAPETEDQHD